MHLLSLILLVIVAGLVVVVWATVDREKQKNRSHRLSGRPLLSTDEWYAKYGMGLHQGALIEVAGRLSQVLGCQLVQIYPEDRFDVELSIAPATKEIVDSDDALTLFFERDIPELLSPDIECGSFRTVAEVVQAVTVGCKTDPVRSGGLES